MVTRCLRVSERKCANRELRLDVTLTRRLVLWIVKRLKLHFLSEPLPLQEDVSRQ